MKQKNHKKRMVRLLTAVFAAVMLLSLLPITVSARETGRTVDEDYYSLTDSSSVKMPGLTYYCSGHGDKMVEYYVEEENESQPEIPGLIKRVGNKIRYVGAYYCKTCYANWVKGAEIEPGADVEIPGKDHNSDNSLESYFAFVSSSSAAALGGGGYWFVPKDDFEHYPNSRQGDNHNEKDDSCRYGARYGADARRVRRIAGDEGRGRHL